AGAWPGTGTARPVPDSVTTLGQAAPVTTATLAVASPGVVGAKLTVIVWLAPGAMISGKVTGFTVNAPAPTPPTFKAVTVTGAVPGLVSVIVCEPAVPLTWV